MFDDIIELNEAFASQSLACIRDLNIEEKKLTEEDKKPIVSIEDKKPLEKKIASS